ncbi:hypothetical protein CBS101457_006961 [Exobasidium rhododendri]|nr:hypothetical protein CBS101457_006961 [Exobasidium rhododendri]
MGRRNSKLATNLDFDHLDASDLEASSSVASTATSLSTPLSVTSDLGLGIPLAESAALNSGSRDASIQDSDLQGGARKNGSVYSNERLTNAFLQIARAFLNGDEK